MASPVSNTQHALVDDGALNEAWPADPMSGHHPHNHTELATRLSILRDSERNGHDVSGEIDAIITAWEQNRT